MEPYLIEYLDSVGIVEGVVAGAVACEVCGNEDGELLVSSVETGPDSFGKLPVVGCRRCGFIYQNPRFDKSFYDRYYDKYYRKLLFGGSQPERDFVVDQIRRGEFLQRSLAEWLPSTGRLLDVGCSAGGLMVPFAKCGWEVFGTDPDSMYAEFGRARLGLTVVPVAAEDMQLQADHFDLIIITGSLEHVFDVNRVLAICRHACRAGGLLFIEGRALNYGIQKGFFSHNHRRYLTIHSIELLMLKHGWTPLLATEQPVCGPTRPGGQYVLGRADAPLTAAGLLAEIAAGRRDDLATIQQRLIALRRVA